MMRAALLQFFTVECRWRELGWNSEGVRESNEGVLRPGGLMVVNHTSPLAFCRSTGFTVGSI